MTVLAAHNWPTNAHLMMDVHSLFPLHVVRDVTYGRGNWWTILAEEHPSFICEGSDIRGLAPSVRHPHFGLNPKPVDFRSLPDADASWPVVALDPPYLPQTNAQQTSSTLLNKAGETDFADRYGLDSGQATNAEELRVLIACGLKECSRIVQPRGFVLLKCMNYVVAGKHRPQVAWAINDCEASGLDVAAQFVHLKAPGPQPTGKPRTIRSPRANYSTLIVFRRR